MSDQFIYKKLKRKKQKNMTGYESVAAWLNSGEIPLKGSDVMYYVWAVIFKNKMFLTIVIYSAVWQEK